MGRPVSEKIFLNAAWVVIVVLCFAVGRVGWMLYTEYPEQHRRQLICEHLVCPYATRVESNDQGCKCTRVMQMNCSWALDAGQGFACNDP